MADDPRKRHPEYAHTDPPAPERRIMGVRVPPLKAPPEPKEGPVSPKVEPTHIDRGTSPAPATHHDPWVNRITAAIALVGAISAAGWGGAKMTERDVPSSKEAKTLTVALNSCESAVVRLTKKVEEGEARDKEQAQRLKLQAEQSLAHAHVIYLLNGRVAPIWRWPEPRESEWVSGTDNLHQHNRRGGAYPGSE